MSIASVRRRVRRRGLQPAVSRLEERTLLSTITWASDVSGDWDNPSMWTGDVVPGPGDDAQINFSGITVTHASGTSDSVNSLSSQAALDLSNGSLALASASSISGDLTLEGATLSTAGTLTVSGSMTWVGGTVSGGGSLVIANGATLNMSGFGGNDVTLDGVVLENAGAATLTVTNCCAFELALENGAGIDNKSTGSFAFVPAENNEAAEITSDGTATFFTNEGTLSQPSGTMGQTIIEPAFTQTATGMTSVQTGQVTLQSTATNAGMVTVTSGATLGVGIYTQTAGITALSGGTISGGSISINGGALTGSGTINANVNSGGQVIPGGAGAAGLLTINGTYTQTDSGSLNVDLGGTTAGSQYGQLAVSGTATLGGQLDVSLLNSFLPGLGNAFQPLTFASSSGNFGFYNGIVLGNCLILDPALNPTNLTLTVQPAVTTTTLSAPPSPSVSGQSVTFTATVSVALPPTTIDPTPTGTVTFNNNGTSIGTGMLSLVGGQEQASFSTSTLSTTSHSITAAYTSGDGNFNASPASTALAQVVNKDSTTTSVRATPSLANVGQTVTFRAVITANAPGSGTPTGTVDFYDTTTSTDLTPGGVTLSSGTATFSTTSLAVGSHIVQVTYSGDTNCLTSSASTGSIMIGQSIIVLDPSAGGALSLSGNASISLTGGVYVDSSSSSALSANGNAAVKASVIDVTGRVSKSGNASFSPAPATGAATVPDPLASLALPSTSGLTNYGSESLSGNSSATIRPGIYSQISVSGNGTLILNSGVYIVEGGGFTVSGNASVSGSGVMIVNAGSAYPSTGGTYGSITLSGNGSCKLSPPTTGTYAGIVIFQTRDNSKALTLSGNASGMTGTVYAPAAPLAESGNAQLNAAIIANTVAISGNGIANTLTLASPSGTVAYTPAQIRAAYGISTLSLDGTGQTIAIVDAYDDPSIDQSLDAFDSQFALTASGPTLYAQYEPAASFLTVLNQHGQATSLPSTDPNGPATNNWEVEEALDVEWAHAIAPGAQIILVEANSQSLADLMASVGTAASQPGVSVVSMSWGFPEGQAVFASDEATYDSVFNVPGVTFVASTGDYGAADPEYPAFSPNVVAVGGTSLTLNTDGSYNSEAGWGYESSSVGAFIGSGGGISLYKPEPAYQQGVQSTGYRTTPDVSLVADPATGAWIADPYNLNPSNPFEIVGGTSLSAPAWAALLALVDQGRAAAGESGLNSTSPTDTQQALYMLPQSDYNVIASGSNGYTAGTGYNLVTGLGTPVANLLVADLVAYQGPGTSHPGPGVGPLQDASLVDPTAASGGPIDVFSVFDSLTVASNGIGHAGAAGTGSANRAIVKINAPGSPTAGSMTPLAASVQTPATGSTSQGLMALDSVISNWTPASNSVMKRLTPSKAGGEVSLGFPGESILSAVNVSTRSPVLQVGTLDAVVAGDLDIPSPFAGKGQLYPSRKVKTPGQVTGS